MINKNIHSYPLLDISTYFDDFINQRKLFLKETRHSTEYDINNIQHEVNKVIDSYINLNQSSSSLINRLNKVIVKFKSLDENNTELIMYLKRYFELHRVLYAEFDSKKRKLAATSQKNDINMLFAVSYLLQLMYTKTNYFNYLSTSVKINEFILNNFTLHKLKNYPLIKYLINHELLILRNYDENI